MSKVLKISNAQIRNDIEKITDEDQMKGSIKFQQDINGDWVVGVEVLDDPDFLSVRDLLVEHSVEIEFAGLPLPEGI